ncbi:hypothetical protein GC197_11360 [bacterium]|nr:hypothetical protein [bacterium]
MRAIACFTRALKMCAPLLLLVVLSASSSAEIHLPRGDQRQPIKVRADDARHWQDGDKEVWILSGNCEITQGNTIAKAQDAVLWIEYAQPFRLVPHKVTVYLENKAYVNWLDSDDGPAIYQGPTWLGQMFTTSRVELPVDDTKAPPAVAPAIYHRGRSAQPSDDDYVAKVVREQPIQQIQYDAGEPMPPAFSVEQPQIRVRLLQRYSTGYHLDVETDPNTGETIGRFDQGMNLIVEGLGELDSVSLLADRAIIWSKNGLEGLSTAEGAVGDGAYEVYLEGNVVFHQGEKVIYAERMYYNVQEKYGMIMSAELLTPIPDYKGLVRLKADVLQQVDPAHFQAFGAAITTSRMGVPRYWFQSSQIEYTDQESVLANPITGEAQIDPLTGQPKIDHKRLATSRNNTVYVSGIPVFYWPVLSADINDPVFYLNKISFKNDQVFGFQVRSEFDNYEILGIDNPWEGTEWVTDLDYLSMRGVGVGTQFNFNNTFFPYFNNPATGFLEAWGIHDTGTDNLGADRRNLPPETNWRGRVWGRHRQMTFWDFQFTGQLGLISDRNFLESFYEKDWDTQKDFDTSFELKKLVDNQSFNIYGSSRVNDFFMQTEWMPKLDHYMLGQPLLFDRLTYLSHSSIGYARLRPSAAPKDPAELAKWTPLPYETDVEGIVGSTRHEIDAPMEILGAKIVPYAMGDLTYQQQDLNGNDMLRGLVQGGVRGSIMAWTANRSIQSQLLNLNGVAHKVTLYGDMYYADSSQNLARVAIYDKLNDDSQEAFQRRFPVNTYGLPVGTPVPTSVDPRYYAFRSNQQGLVTSPVGEIANDVAAAKLQLHQVWQTKRGGPGNEKIIDWIKLDVGGTLFPDKNRDNFGQTLGLLNYDFDWQVGNRLSVFSNGFWDLFDNGLQTMTIGSYINRTQVGNLYVSYTNTIQPFRSKLLVASLQYRLSEKWFGGLGTSYDLVQDRNLGQNIFLTRIGESSLFTLNFNINNSRNNVGIGINFEPRFFATGQYSKINGEPLPPLGAQGLE